MKQEIQKGSKLDSQPRILLTSTNRWPSPSRMAIGFARSGCRVFAICPRRGHPLHSTRVVERTFTYSSFRPLDSLKRAINAANPDIVVPCDDRAVQHLHELYAEATGQTGSSLRILLERSLGPVSSYPVVSSRSELLHIAAEEGIRVPETQPVLTIQELENWGGHAFPWVLKGDGTFGGKGVRIAQTREEAERFFREITELFTAARVVKRAIVNRDPFWLRPWWNGHKPAVSVQSFVNGYPGNCGFVSWEGEVLAFIGVEVVSSEGQTGPADIVRVAENSEMEFAAKQLARRLGLSGFFGLDFMIERETGATYLIELNPRCTPVTHLSLGKGRDMTEAFSAQLAGRPVVDAPPITENRLIAYFPQLWQCKSEFLKYSYHDVPQGEPELVEDMRRPWPDSSLLYRAVSKLSGVAASAKGRTTAKGGLI